MVTKKIIGPVELKLDTKNTNNYITRICNSIEDNNKSIRAFLPESNRRARLLNELKSFNNHRNNNLPFLGLTVGVKDIFYVDGLPTRAGSNLPSYEFHDQQATIVTILKKNGAIILGKTVTTEFTSGEPKETVNPVDHKYSPGGSSSGSAAAVAAGICDLGIGSQTIGSTLRPASYCGIVGFKPTFARIDTKGIIPYAPSLDTVGFLTRNVAKLIPISKKVFKKWINKNESESLPILGIPIGNYLFQADSLILKIFENTVQHLKENGFTIKEIPLFDDITQINENLWTLATYEMAKVHKVWYSKYKQLYRPKTKALIEKGLKVDKLMYLNVLKEQKKILKFIEYTTEQSGIDLWIAPAATTYAPKMVLSFTGDPAMNIPWTYAGLPSLSIPIKHSGILPLGLQIIAGYNKDEVLLSEGLIIEKQIN